MGIAIGQRNVCSAQTGRRATRAGEDASTGGPAPRRLQPLVRAGVTAALLLLIAACSSIRLGYNNADTLILYALDSYFDLDDEQERFARERVRALLAWHRRTQLTDYAALLDGAQRTLDAPLAANDVLSLQAGMNARLMTLGTQAAPALAQLVRTLTPAQMEHFNDKLARDIAKARRELVRLNGKKVEEDRIERALERTRGWLGALTPEQESLVREAILKRPDGERRWLDERERRHRAFVAVLDRIRAEQLSPDAGTAVLVAYFAALIEPAQPERRATVMAMREANAQLIAQVLNSATPEQKATLFRKLRGYADDFTVLASEGAPG